MVRLLGEHEPFRNLITRLYAILLDEADDTEARISAALFSGAIAGTVINPLVDDIDDDTLRSVLIHLTATHVQVARLTLRPHARRARSRNPCRLPCRIIYRRSSRSATPGSGGAMQILADAEDLPKTANIKTQLISLWTAPVFGVVLLIAFLAFPGFFPPMSPAMTAEQVANFYSDNAAMIRFSMITFNLCGIMLLPFFMVIVIQMKRMATQSHVFAYCYLTAAVSGATLFALADIFYLVAAFRPDRNPELVLLLNDMAWMIFIAPVGVVVAHEPIARAGNLFRRRTQPGVSQVGRALRDCHRGGDGAGRRRRCVQHRAAGVERCVSFWLRNAAFVAFVIVMFFVLRIGRHRQAVEEGVAR